MLLDGSVQMASPELWVGLSGNLLFDFEDTFNPKNRLSPGVKSSVFSLLSNFLLVSFSRAFNFEAGDFRLCWVSFMARSSQTVSSSVDFIGSKETEVKRNWCWDGLIRDKSSRKQTNFWASLNSLMNQVWTRSKSSGKTGFSSTAFSKSITDNWE